MRALNSLKSLLTAFLANGMNILLGFVIQALLNNILGIEYVGLNGLLSNIIAMLSIAELGIGVAILSNLYKPIADRDKEKIKSLLSLYKKCFNVIAGIIAFIGIILIPFLDNIIGETTIKENIYIFYMLFLLDAVLSYLLIYKRSIVQADQKAYIINLVHLICIIFMYAMQITALLIFKSYLIFLIARVIFRVFENIIISIIANKLYPYIKEKNVNRVDESTLQNIKRKVKSLVLHKVGSFVVNCSDNLVITKILGLAVTGLYSNYSIITTALNSFFNQAFSSIAGSLGNLIVENDKSKSYYIYKKLLFFNAWVYTFFVSAFFSIITPFVKIWLGGEFLLPPAVVCVLVINFYLQGVRNTINLFKDTAGIFYEDRFMPILEVVVNLVISIVLAKYIGLMGVLIGTIVSTLIVCIYGHAKYVYTPLFGKNRVSYLLEHGKYVCIAIIDTTVTYIIVSLLTVNNNLVQCIINGCVAIVITNIINYIILRKTDEFKYYKNFIFKILRKNV